MTFVIAGTVGQDWVTLAPELGAVDPLPAGQELVLEAGWHRPERWPDVGWVRWTDEDAVLQVLRAGASALTFLAKAPLNPIQSQMARILGRNIPAPVVLTAWDHDRELARVEIGHFSWASVCIPLSGAPQRIVLRLSESLGPRGGELRRLGVATRRFGWVEGETEIPVNLPSLYRTHALPPNVLLTGWFDEEAKPDLLNAADVAINPMFEGSGSNLKVLEFLAAGLPLVSTSVGIRGIDIAPGQEALVAEAEGLAPAITDLMQDPPKRASLAEAGRRRVLDRYDWGRIAEGLSAELLSLVRPG